MTYILEAGTAAPLGATLSEDGINFSLLSIHAQKVTLVLFHPDEKSPFLTATLDEKKNKTKHAWHIFVRGLKGPLEYAYQIDGPKDLKKGHIFNPALPLLDPYAKALSSSTKWMEPTHSLYQPKGRVFPIPSFDWEHVTAPNLEDEDWFIYEMHVRGLTQHTSSQTTHPGSFLGVVEKIPYLKSLGINAIELLPVFEFNEKENHVKNPITHKPLCNFWGYSTVNFFCPMQRFASKTDWNAAITEFKIMVRELHRNGIAVILDVVYNHTAEGNETGPCLSFKGIDNSAYYMMTQEGHYYNFSGTGNTFNCNHPLVLHLIVDSLRYWAEEMHVDGFRFDLASILTRGFHGHPLDAPPLIKAINEDPILSKKKMIAEAWDAGGLYQVGSFPGQGKWSEWNGKYRDVVRKFIKGTDGQVGPFATALCGSQNLYGHDRKPYHSINFVTAHDGYSLYDLVAYQDKHNLANGEGNRDGTNENDSWNCGKEGPTSNKKTNALRTRQMKNFFVALNVSLGTPMFLMGDEYGHTRKGNNNPYCQDNELNWFLWDELEEANPLLRFYKCMIAFRKKNKSLLCKREFLTDNDINWHGYETNNADWSPNSRFIAYTLKNSAANQNLYIAFNAGFEHAFLQLPSVSQKWHLIADTSLASPYDFQENPEPLSTQTSYILSPYSSLILQEI